MTEMSEEMIMIVKNADAFCFDVDSTVVTTESFLDLSIFCGKSDRVQGFITRIMEGQTRFEELLQISLNNVKPSYSQVRAFIEQQLPTLSPNIKKLVQRIQTRKVPIYLISGGFVSIIQPIATKLNIPHENIYANRLKFYCNGEYAGFDEEAPCSRAGGKALVIKSLKEKHGYKNLILIGDGATDLEAYPPADTFIGYGGNVIRQIVKDHAKWFITDFDEILYVMEK